MDEVKKDDQETGRILTRREVLSILGTAAAGAGLVGSKARASVPECVGRPQQTEGPYYLDSELNRADIRSEPTDGLLSEGVPLTVEFRVSRVTPQSCVPLSGAVVDVWHCDAKGEYSGVRDPHFDTRGKKFLRGYQVTDASGTARFKTIYPGWYAGRTVHMHFKIRTNASGRAGAEFTSQLYFEDGITDQVYKRPPYAARGPRMMRNSDDFVFRGGGDRLLLQPKTDGDGYSTVFDIALG
jgi:protocatechuate 3,4-dioxygenase beta subunit